MPKGFTSSADKTVIEEGDAKRFTFSIPLKAQDKPIKFSKALEGLLHDEYLTRYAEALGITPSPQVLEQLRKHLPRNNVRIVAAWKAQGWKTDTVQMSRVFKTFKTEGWVPNPDDVLANTIKKEEDAFKALRASSDSSEKPANPAAAATTAKKAMLCLEHFVAVHAFLRMTQKDLQPPPPLFEVVPKPYEVTVEELRKPIAVSVTKIEELQHEFIKNFPLDRVNDRYHQSDLDILEREITSPHAVQLVALLCHHCYWTLFGDYPTDHLDDGDKEGLVLAIEKLRLLVDARLRRHKKYTLFHLPLTIDAACTTIQLLFRKHFPRWYNTPLGEVTDQEIIRLVDACFGVLQPLQTVPTQTRASKPDHSRAKGGGGSPTPAATVAAAHASILSDGAAGQSDRPGGRKLRNVFHATSRLIKSIFPDISSAETRKFRQEEADKKAAQERARLVHERDAAKLIAPRILDPSERKVDPTSFSALLREEAQRARSPSSHVHMHAAYRPKPDPASSSAASAAAAGAASGSTDSHDNEDNDHEHARTAQQLALQQRLIDNMREKARRVLAEERLAVSEGNRAQLFRMAVRKLRGRKREPRFVLATAGLGKFEVL